MKLKVKYLSVTDICGYAHGKEFSYSGKSSGEHFKSKLITALESDADIVYVNYDMIYGVGASWIDGAFGKLNPVHQELVQQKVYIRTEKYCNFLIDCTESLLGKKLITHYEIVRKMESAPKKQNFLSSFIGKIFK